MKTEYAIACLLCALPLPAERITVALSDPTRPAQIRFHSVNHGIDIRTHDAREVAIDFGGTAPSTQPAANGMKQIPMGMSGLRVEQENNVVSIQPSHRTGGSLVVYAPRNSSEKLKAVNAKDVRIEGLEGEIDADVVNGSITLVDVSGPVVAHSLNGRLTATLKRVPEGKPMSFSTLNGRIDVTLPAAAKADLNIRNKRGETYSDFEMQLSPTVTRRDNKGDGPKYRLSIDSGIVGKVNGGGPEYSFRSMNGTIYIRKGN